VHNGIFDGDVRDGRVEEGAEEVSGLAHFGGAIGFLWARGGEEMDGGVAEKGARGEGDEQIPREEFGRSGESAG
jgi:hypothetical protein